MTGPRVRTVNALSEFRPPDGTQAFWRAMSEADGFIHDAELGAEAVVRVQELEQLVADITALHHTVRGHLCLECGDQWPCRTTKLIEGKS